MLKFLKSYYRSIIWLVFILYALFTPGNKLPHPSLLNFENADKLVHLILFMGLAYLLLFDTWLYKTNLSKIQTLKIFIIAALLGIITEIVQHNFIKNRSGNIMDFYADLVGIVLALGVFYISRNIINRFFRPIS